MYRIGTWMVQCVLSHPFEKIFVFTFNMVFWDCYNTEKTVLQNWFYLNGLWTWFAKEYNEVFPTLQLFGENGRDHKAHTLWKKHFIICHFKARSFTREHSLVHISLSSPKCWSICSSRYVEGTSNIRRVIAEAFLISIWVLYQGAINI